MSQQNIYLTRRFFLKSAADSAYRASLSPVTLERSVSSGLRAAFDHTISLTSNQSAYTIPFGDVASARHFLVEADQMVKVVMNTTSSVRVGVTSAVAAMLYVEGSTTAATVANLIPSAATSVRVRGWGKTA